MSKEPPTSGERAAGPCQSGSLIASRRHGTELTSDRVEHRLDDFAGPADAITFYAILGVAAAPVQTQGVFRERFDDAAQKRLHLGKGGLAECDDAVVCPFQVRIFAASRMVE